MRIEEVGTVEAVADLAELIALCAYLRAEEIAGDGPVWAATAAALGSGQLDAGRSSLRLDNDPSPLERLARAQAGDEAVENALATHRETAALKSRRCLRCSSCLLPRMPRPRERRSSPAMLIVGLIFLGVIVLGETTHWLRHRRR